MSEPREMGNQGLSGREGALDARFDSAAHRIDEHSAQAQQDLLAHQGSQATSTGDWSDWVRNRIAEATQALEERLASLESQIQDQNEKLFKKTRMLMGDLDQRKKSWDEELSGLREELRASSRAASDPELAALRAEVAAQRQKLQDFETLMERIAAHLFEDARAELRPLPEASPAPPPSVLPDGSVSRVLGALQDLSQELHAQERQELDRSLKILGDLHEQMEEERKFEERAGALVELLRTSMLASRSRDGLAESQARLLFTEIPDLLGRLEDLARRASTPETRRKLEEFRRQVLDQVGLEDIEPRQGDPFNASRHNMLQADPDEGPEQTVARCFSRGLALKATGQLVRKANVSVYL